jgi:ParB family chromosome partitioning protein
MSQLESKPSPLGTGLNALFNNTLHIATNEEFKQVQINCVRPAKYQPRQTFDPDEIQELAESIKQQGILQPIIVRPVDEIGFQYEIVAGERRWKAAQQAGLSQIPVYIRAIDERQALEIAIIENIQRSDLNLIEEGQAYQRLVDNFGYTHEAVAQAVRKSRSYISNAIRLLNLPEEIQDAVRKDMISASHARTLINMENAEELVEKIKNNQINVRQTEALKKQKKNTDKTNTEPKNQDLQTIEESLTLILQMPVIINCAKNEGEIIIKFKNMEQLDRLVDQLNQNNKPTSSEPKAWVI